MSYIIRAVFEDGTSKNIEYADNYGAAVSRLMSIADQRLTYAAAIPLLKNVQLISGNAIQFDMHVVRGAFQSSDVNKITGSRDGGRSERSNLVLMSSYRRPLSALDMLTRWEPSRISEAGFYSGIDNEAQTIRVMGSGPWRKQNAELYFEQQQRIVTCARSRFDRLKVVFDVRNWLVENQQSALQFQEMNKELYRHDDFLAAVVRTVADKAAPRTALQGNNTEVFTSVNEAEFWLLNAAGGR